MTAEGIDRIINYELKVENGRLIRIFRKIKLELIFSLCHKQDLMMFDIHYGFYGRNLILLPVS